MPDPSSAVPVLVGRDAEVGRLAGLVREAAAGRGAVVWVEGEPGIGKTTLLDAAVAECARLGVRVARGEAEELERRLPFAAVGSALGVRLGAGAGGDLDPGVARLAALLRGERAFASSAAAANHELVVVEAVLELVDRWCAAGPVALVVDDVQWADAASVVALHRLGRAVEAEPLALLMVLAARPVPRGDAVTGLVQSLRTRGAEQLRVAPLAASAVAGLVERLAGASPGPRLLGLVAGAGGNPMYIAELVAALGREGLVHLGGGMAEVPADAGSRATRDAGTRDYSRQIITPVRSLRDPSGPHPRSVGSPLAQRWDGQLMAGVLAGLGGGWLPRSLLEAIQRRLGFLPAKVREMLEVAAVLGAALDVAELSGVLDMPLGVLSEMVAEAMAAGLLAEAGQALVFRHDLIRAALAANRPASVRVALRLRAGQVLAAAGAPVERVAEHLAAGVVPELATVEWLVRSADALTVRAPELAVKLLRSASTVAEGNMAGELRFYLARALLWAGELVEAEHTAWAALAAHPDVGREGGLRWLLAQACYRQGRVGDAVAAAEGALASPRLAPAERGRFHGFIAFCLHMLEQLDEAETAARKALSAAETHRDPTATVYGCITLASRNLALGKLRESLRCSDRALVAYEAGDQTDLEVDPYLARARCLVGLDRRGEADEVLVGSLRYNQRSGAVYLPSSHRLRAWLRFLDGRWDDALAEVQAGLDVPDPYHLAGGLPPLATLVSLHRGTDTPDVADAGTREASRGRRAFDYLKLWARGLVAEARGNPGAALDLLYPAWEKPPGLTSRRTVYEICPDLARLAATVGNVGRAQELATTTEAQAAWEPSPSMNGTALLCRGLADADPAPLVEAARCFHEAGWPLYEGYGHEEAAVLLARHGNTAEARRPFDDALALYAGLDAAWDASRAQARLRRLGVRRVRRTVLRRRPTHGWEALTETEHKVAALVAEGLSNPDIAIKICLSRRTVQSHVSRILAKLELGSRVEVAVSAQRRTPT